MAEALTEQGFSLHKPGDVIGYSHWVVVDQQLIDQFGIATIDDDPMHLDPQWAKDTGPYGGTIAFGFWTMSMLTHLFHSASGTEPARIPAREGYYLNYGIDRLRLITPVPVGGRIRGHFGVGDVRIDEKQRIIVTFDVTIEIEGEERPALVGKWLAIWVRP